MRIESGVIFIKQKFRCRLLCKWIERLAEVRITAVSYFSWIIEIDTNTDKWWLFICRNPEFVLCCLFLSPSFSFAAVFSFVWMSNFENEMWIFVIDLSGNFHIILQFRLTHPNKTKQNKHRKNTASFRINLFYGNFFHCFRLHVTMTMMMILFSFVALTRASSQSDCCWYLVCLPFCWLRIHRVCVLVCILSLIKSTSKVGH